MGRLEIRECPPAEWSAAAGPGGRTNPPRGAAYGDLRFEFGYGAMRVHGGR